MKQIIKNNIKAVTAFVSILFITSCSDQEKDFVGEPLVTYPAVTVSSVSPSEGTSGNVITLTGTNFGQYVKAAKIYFNGILADEILTYNDTSVTVRVPQDAGTGPITVKVWTNKVITADFTYLTGATISGLSPTSANVGELVTISGQGFGTDLSKVQVTFTDGIIKYDAKYAKVISVSDKEIRAIVPKDAVTGRIRVWLANQIITGPELKIIAPPKGKYIFEFDDPTDIQWLPAQNATYKIEDSKLKVTFDPTLLGTSASKRRADLYNIISGIFPSPSGTAKAKWVQSPTYPILAMKIAFVATGSHKPVSGNIILDPAVSGGINSGNNKYKTDFVAQNVIYYDLSADYLTETELSTRQFKIADIVGSETGYEVDWIRTFKSKAELQAFLGL
ncbi:IPT/TIG domain-containing protein [Flavobacterium ajazii]|uniref:IPT/TIG domain-containing protein n=1 Tax=Flavobacterium ajazii TaxID=2692318 RepID=UPI0013D0CE9B|nr:IPT/TIG domain-containing protein [Flavobacterium ajazii]